MQRIDRAAIERYGIPRLLLMDRAGQALARTVLALPRPARSQLVLICAGGGYNGGDGLCAGWHLAQAGRTVQIVLLTTVDRLREEPAVYARILRALRVPIHVLPPRGSFRRLDESLRRAGVVIDALLGIGTRGLVKPEAGAVIDRINRAGTPVVAADVPSGLDADTGRPLGAAIRATVTVCFGAIKRGLLAPAGRRCAGRIVVDEIGIPPRLLAGPPARARRSPVHG